MSSFKLILSQTFWQILGKIVTSLSTFIILASVARSYGEEGTGVFTLTTTYLAIFYLFADFGFNGYVLKQIKEQDLDLKTQWAKLLGARVIWALILICISLALLPFLPFTTNIFFTAVLFGCVDILMSAIFITNSLVFQAKLKYELVMIAIIIGRVFGLGIFLYSAYLKVSIPLLIFSYLLGGMIISAISLYLVTRVIKKISISFDFLYIKNLLKKSWPIAATLGLNVVYFRVDTFILASFKSSSDVGIYNLAFSIFQSALVLPTFIMNAYYPMMLKSFKGIKLVGIGLLLIASLGTLVTLILSPFILQLLTGGGFEGSVTSLQILSFGFPAYFLSALLMWIFVSEGLYKKMLAIYTSGLVFNIILNLFFIPRYSYIAASLITVISEYAILVLQILVLKRINKNDH